MAIRHAAAGFMEVERGFRRVKGFMQLPKLDKALSAAIQERLKNGKAA
jgi:hypothetical protein